jgi:hypothetical protein
MHAIGVPRNVTWVKFHKAWLVKLEPVREQEVQSEEAGEGEGTLFDPNREPSSSVKASPIAL